jgi:hypothetical protein
MRYIMLIYGNESDRPAPGTPEQQAIMKEYFDYGDMVVKRGVFKSGDALMPSGTATTVRVSDGSTLTTDGPFAETKEQLGGFYILDCKDLDEAIELAAQIPDARSGACAIEVRPLMEIPAQVTG